MASAHSTKIEDDSQSPRPEEQLSQLFGGYRAEWLREQLFDLFTEPAYFPELETSRPCMLEGGRGTGKTTVLRCLSYEGQFALRGKDPSTIQSWRYYGFYHRVNTNRVTAFRGPEVTEETWTKLFAHYFNLLLCDSVIGFLRWYNTNLPEAPVLHEEDCKTVAASLQIQSATTIDELSRSIARAKLQFEASINNVADAQFPPLSLQGSPIDALCDAILRLPQFAGKYLFFLLDEYENFEDYQQKVVNTLIKHCGSLYTFKVGVRELGWRARATLNENEQLISPADYARISIAERLSGERFRSFARQVCNSRISKLSLPGVTRLNSVDQLLPELSEDEEANALGVDVLASAVRAELDRDPVCKAALAEMTPLMIYFIQFWAAGQEMPLKAVLDEYRSNRNAWLVRFDNYKHALLFTIRRGKRGIQKYYAGWDTFCNLAAANIRYLLELVDQSFLYHLRVGGSLGDPIPPETQTTAAQNVGKKNLSELEGLSVHGAQLTKLLLGLGRIFEVMASEAEGHAPEVNQFHIDDNTTSPSASSLTREEEPAVENLLNSAVMHLALLRSPGNKLGNVGDTRDYDYMMHPIFSAFFVFSYRRKRKLVLTQSQVLGLIRSPKETIKEVLESHNRIMDQPLPHQLLLFESYYDGGAEPSATN